MVGGEGRKHEVIGGRMYGRMLWRRRQETRRPSAATLLSIGDLERFFSVHQSFC